jgi:hypothetical protein
MYPPGDHPDIIDSGKNANNTNKAHLKGDLLRLHLFAQEIFALKTNEKQIIED